MSDQPPFRISNPKMLATIQLALVAVAVAVAVDLVDLVALADLVDLVDLAALVALVALAVAALVNAAANLSSLMYTITEETAAAAAAAAVIMMVRVVQAAHIMLNLNPAPTILEFISNMEILDRQWFYSDGHGGE
jgi:fucose 4-O-acetylase-like acetyltransferase